MSMKLSDFKTRLLDNYLVVEESSVTSEMIVDAGTDVVNDIMAYKSFNWRWLNTEIDLQFSNGDRFISLSPTGNKDLYKTILSIVSLHIDNVRAENRYYPKSKDYFESFLNYDSIGYTTNSNGAIIYNNVQKVYCTDIDTTKIYINPAPESDATFKLNYENNFIITNIDTELDIPDDFKTCILYGLISNLCQPAIRDAETKNTYFVKYRNSLETLYKKYKKKIDKNVGTSINTEIAHLNRLGRNRRFH